MSSRQRSEEKRVSKDSTSEGAKRAGSDRRSCSGGCRAAAAPAGEPSGDTKRRKKRTNARARTISIRRLSKTELNRGREEYPETAYWKPRTRGDCKDMERPCPYVSCKYHLFIDVHPVRGSIKINFPDLEVWEMTESCALDIADRGGITLEDVGVIMNLTRERVRQLETQGLGKLKVCEGVEKLEEYLG
jgi:hypothetical protein